MVFNQNTKTNDFWCVSFQICNIFLKKAIDFQKHQKSNFLIFKTMSQILLNYELWKRVVK